MDEVSAYDVFTITAFPIYTYVSRKDKYEEDLEFTVKSRTIGFVHGPTKSGKSVLADFVADKLGRDCCKIIARDFKSAEEFWNTVARELNIPESVNISQTQSKGNEKTVSALARVTTWIFGEAEISGSLTNTNNLDRTTTYNSPINPKKKLKKITLIIDNFHYILERNVQREILRDLRNLLGEVAVVIIAITSERDYLVRIEPELTGRCKPITIREWSEAELMEIVEKGFKKLNLEVTGMLRRKLYLECFESPAIMQALCLLLALNLGYQYPAQKRGIKLTITTPEIERTLNKVFKKTSELFPMNNVYDKIIDIVINSNITDSSVSIRAKPINGLERRNIEHDTNISIYEAILQALVAQPGSTIALNEIIRSFMGTIITGTNVAPPYERILSLLDNASAIVWRDEISKTNSVESKIAIETSLLVWDPSKKQITITDPYFGFFMRWSGYIHSME